MKFILTGHKGLIGSALLKKLKSQGHTPILLIDKRDNKDIINIDKIQLTEKPDIFIHLAAACKINKTIAEPDWAFQNNVLGIHKIMEFCRKNKIPKIVFTSSSRILSPEKNPYTASKIYSEELIKGYAQCYRIKYIIIRPSTVYGPFNDKTKRLIDLWMSASLKGEELKIFGDKAKTLDFTYSEDFIEAFLLAMQQNNKEFNIAGGKGISLDYVADYIIKLAGKGTKNFYPEEIAQPQEVELDISAIKALGWEPKTSIEEGLKKTFDWYKENWENLESKFYHTPVQNNL